MLAKNTCAAAEEIAEASADDDFTEVIDRLSAEHVGDGNSNPYHKGEVLSWQKTAYRNLPDGYDSFLEELQQSPQKKTEYTTDTQYVYGRVVSLSDGSEAEREYPVSVLPSSGRSRIFMEQLTAWKIFPVRGAASGYVFLKNDPGHFSLNLISHTSCLLTPS